MFQSRKQVRPWCAENNRMKFRPINTVHTVEWNDEQYRAQFSIDAFRQIQADSAQDIIFYYWDTLRQGGRIVPALTDFKPFQVFPPSMLNRVSWIDTPGENPENFVIRNHRGGAMFPIYGSVEGHRLGDYPNRMHRRSTVEEYQLCKRLKRPFYHEFVQVLGGGGRSYSRILMPLADENGVVIRIAYVTSPNPLIGLRSPVPA